MPLDDIMRDVDYLKNAREIKIDILGTPEVHNLCGTADDAWKCDVKRLVHSNCSKEKEAAGVVCSGQKGPRLVGGNSTCSGRVEILLGDTWGTVCRHPLGFTECGRHLQSPRLWDHDINARERIPWRGKRFNMYDIMECVGNELRLSNCPVSSWGHYRCTHSNDVGVICSGPQWQMRLASGESVCDGRLEVYYGGVWGRVMDTDWNFNDADVVCRQLNCGSAISTYNQSKAGGKAHKYKIGNIKLSRELNRKFMAQTMFRTWNSRPHKSVEMNCMCKRELDKRMTEKMVERYDDCEINPVKVRKGGDTKQSNMGPVSKDVELRLAAGFHICSGRVEIFFSDTWGTVCDDSWDLHDAAVVCRQLNYDDTVFTPGGTLFDPVNGTIRMDDVKCRGSERFLWDCQFSTMGDHDCEHKEDVNVAIRSTQRLSKSRGSPFSSFLAVLLRFSFQCNCFSGRVAEKLAERCVPKDKELVTTMQPSRTRQASLWCADGDKFTAAQLAQLIADFGGCVAGEHRAVWPQNGPSPCQGRVEVFYHVTWGTVRADSFEMDNAEVVEVRLQYRRPNSKKGRTVYYVLFDTMCLGKIGDYGCDELSSRPGCSPRGAYRLTGQVLTPGDPVLDKAILGNSLPLRKENRFPLNTYSSCLMSAACTSHGAEAQFLRRSIDQMLIRILEYSRREMQRLGMFVLILQVSLVSAVRSSLQPPSQSATVKPLNDKGDVGTERGDFGYEDGLPSISIKQNAVLKGGGSPCAGRVEASSFRELRILCGRMWDMNEAHVFCKYLGCGYAVSASGDSQFGISDWLVLNAEIRCNGTEDDPWKCEVKRLAHRNCSKEKEAAGVVCSEHIEPRLVGGADGCSGRLEIQYGETWGTVCDSHWDSQDARVVCSSLKCGDVISVPGGAFFGEGNGPIWHDTYQCHGNEAILWDCSISPRNHHNCTHRNDVSIICSGQNGPRLVGGKSACSGRVELLLGDTWGTVCDTRWDLQNAAVTCNHLGCGTVISTPGGAFFGEGNGSIWSDIIECVGKELRLSDCPVSSWGHQRCTHRNDAGVICSDAEWQMRLANGESVCDGRVEVYYGGLWGRVIDTEWNFNDADVVCRQLNCGSAISVYNHSKFGKGAGPLWISNVRCNGSEPFLWNCSFTQAKQLSTEEDVGVVCSDHIRVRLADSGSRCAGRVELYYNGTWGTVCDDFWDLANAHVVCNQLKCGQALNATVSGWFGPGAGPIWLHNLTCAANDSVLWECPAGRWAESDCNHKEDAGVICSEHRAVRLQDGPSPCQGRVEVFYNATWGTVCADSFGMEDAEVVCKQLSCGSARSVDRDVTFGRGFGQIWLDEVNCRLHDSLLWQCPSSPWGEHNCDHREDVGVICSEINPIKVRNGGDTKQSNMGPVSEDVELRLAAGFNNCSGRVEIFFSGAWGTVCDDSWDRHDAAVVCRQLNCGDPVWTPGETLFEPTNGTIWMDDVKCKGSERFLWDCQFSAMGDHDCEHKEDVNVICSGHPQYTASFKQQGLSVFIIPCIFVVLFIAVSIALAAELQRSFKKGHRNGQYSTTGFPDPVYEEIGSQELGTGPGLHSNSTLNNLEYYTDSDSHECEGISKQDSVSQFDAEFGREYDDVQ
ncbi:scavenger receptor cysteine-rich type 1 protein M130-like [Cetorhinus maximus]